MHYLLFTSQSKHHHTHLVNSPRNLCQKPTDSGASSLQFTLKKTNLSLPKASSRAIFTAHPSLQKSRKSYLLLHKTLSHSPFKSSSRRPLLLCTALSLKKPYPTDNLSSFSAQIQFKHKPCKASWSPEQCIAFCDICIRAIDMGMRPTSHFDKPGWMYVAKSFAEQTGVVYERDQFKNKWDSCKKNWHLWNKLIGETGVGWSNELKTIAASDEWWRARIQIAPNKSSSKEENRARILLNEPCNWLACEGGEVGLGLSNSGGIFLRTSVIAAAWTNDSINTTAG
uniref:Myb/SANT-like domain-containing protein n=1 Tax=Salix viminalis TaxID=40686 RepID=A0A6N2LGV9_SALVM